jgi:RNA polymerase sigma-70 factor (ECF subfamily)
VGGRTVPAVHFSYAIPDFATRMVHMSPDAAPDVTLLLAAARQGDHDAESQLLSIVYADLRRIARRYRSRERPDNSLNTTALIHEAYLKLLPNSKDFADRAHFFAMASRVMRNILVDHARARLAGKHGGGMPMVNIDDVNVSSDDSPEEMLDLHQALIRLKEFSPRQEMIVELRFFGGMTEEEIASHLNLSVRTIRRDWELSKAWLFGELKNKGKP